MTKLHLSHEELKQIFINSIDQISFEYRPHDQVYSLFSSVRLTPEQLGEKSRTHSTVDFMAHRLQKLNLESQINKTMWEDKLRFAKIVAYFSASIAALFLVVIIAIFAGAK